MVQVRSTPGSVVPNVPARNHHFFSPGVSLTGRPLHLGPPLYSPTIGFLGMGFDKAHCNHAPASSPVCPYAVDSPCCSAACPKATGVAKTSARRALSATTSILRFTAVFLLFSSLIALRNAAIPRH